MIQLFLDLGNTRLKYALLKGRDWVVHGACLYGDADSILQQLGAAHSVDELIVASVSDGNRKAALLGLLGCLFPGVEVDIQSSRPSVGALWRSAYVDPGALGVDRMLAMLGAISNCAGSVCVVDMGTATTVDWVGGNGEHLGGYILAGAELQKKSLFGDTAQIRGSAQLAESLQPAANTAQAVARGALLAEVALLEYLSVACQQRVDNTCSLIVTGGAAKAVLPYLTQACQFDEMLVFKGMRALWEFDKTVTGLKDK